MRTLSRRYLLKSSGLALAASAAAPGFLCRAAALPGRLKRILVALFQRGAVDGLNMVAPYADENYRRMRPSLALGADEVVDLDGRFGLHEALAPLGSLWENKSLAVVHACGSHDSTRSHFDAQDYMESATPGDKGAKDGWLNRYLAAQPSEGATPLRGVCVGSKSARAMAGEAPTVAIGAVRDFRLADDSAVTEDLIRAMYSDPRSGPPTRELLEEASEETFRALELVKQVRGAPYRPARGAQYPRGRFGRKLEQIAQLIKADVGLEVAFADSGGWDTHTNEAPQLQNLFREFAASLEAFARDMGDRMQDILVMTMSEFGRTARENGNRGTDHGHANAMFLLGGSVRGGKVYGEWPGLAEDNLYEGRDLAVTTDFRDVFAEALEKHYGVRSTEAVLPGYRRSTKLGAVSA